MRLLLLYIFFLLPLPATFGQGQTSEDVEGQKRLIYFTDKVNTPYSITEPEQFLSSKAIERRSRQNIAVTARDLPVDPAYVAAIKQLGVEVWYTSRWFNAAVIQCIDEQLHQVEALPYVRSSRTLNSVLYPQQARESSLRLKTEQEFASAAAAELDSSDYSQAFHQLNMLGALDLQTAGYRGEGMTIAVLDTGFPAVNTITAFSHLFGNNQLKGTFDFVLKQQDVFTGNSHGTSVLSTMAAYAPGELIGTAYKANYLLFKTEDVTSEQQMEEINWLLAAEFADSAGADVLNSSLGYTTFDSPSVSYTYDQLNGYEALVTKAADFAAAVGMLVVVSAGNDGNKSWRYVSAPADADSVLTVGAVDSLGIRASFSSFGPTADGRIKPDVVALGTRVAVLNALGIVIRSNGTSFSGPVIAGFATGIWQAYPQKTNTEIIELLKQSGSNATSPDNAIGYGVPSYTRMQAPAGLFAASENDHILITNPVHQKEIVLTLNQYWVQKQVVVTIFDTTGKLIFKQTFPPNISRYVLGLQPAILKQGLYLCRVRSGSRSSTLRFIKL
ncbi:S8 family serine peptidase [Pontibacter silvestris]|uniref:S8 family serine peptidase n=1 Tax=Pontibacter silvestris TaxID=2305183 RepID=A0ABW4WY65_9BACT|nr:S8 family serine peptidase [Pontibacter silvestris]MCC9135288.1 S8 family serine peptidase [Pontibacter silvestris]